MNDGNDARINFYFSFEKLSQTQVSSTKIFSLNGSFSHYDEQGILREVIGSDSKHFVYDRTQDNGTFITNLNLGLSSVPASKSLKSSGSTTAEPGINISEDELVPDNDVPF